MSKILIDSTTAATNVLIPLSRSYPNALNPLPATIESFGLGASETIKIEIGDSQGLWDDFIVNGNLVELTQGNPTVTLYAPVYARLSKPTTAAPVKVTLSTMDDV